MTAYYKDYSTLGNRARQVWGTRSRLRLKATAQENAKHRG
jgi:hypothetical protein